MATSAPTIYTILSPSRCVPSQFPHQVQNSITVSTTQSNAMISYSENMIRTLKLICEIRIKGIIFSKYPIAIRVWFIVQQIIHVAMSLIVQCYRRLQRAINTMLANSTEYFFAAHFDSRRLSCFLRKRTTAAVFLTFDFSTISPVSRINVRIAH